MSDQDKAIVKGNTKGLSPYGEEAEIRIIAERIRRVTPGARNLNDEQCLALAQVAYTIDANPTIGEIQFLVRPNGQPMGFHLGVSLYRRKSRESCDREDDKYWISQDVLQGKEVKAKFKLDANDLVVETLVYRQSQTKAWAEISTTLSEAKAPWEFIESQLGQKPCYRGIGVVTVAEMTFRESKGMHKTYSHYELACKRSETAALKKAFHLNFGAASERAAELELELEHYDVIEGSWTDPNQEQMDEEEKRMRKEWDKLSPEEQKAKAKEAKSSLYETTEEPSKSPTERPFPPETIRNRINASIEEYKGTRKSDKMLELAVWQLNECFAGDDNQNDKRRSVIAYLFEKESATDLSGAELKSVIQWLDSTEDEIGDFKPSKDARDEAIQIVVTRMKEQGQQELL